jgi:tRNA dimethylallyltransferase
MQKLKPKNPLPLVIVILGPTATGKSDLAVTLAKSLNGEVVSADSRQVYRGLTLGTGKITKKEMKGVPHHLLDVANPKKQFTVSDFVKKGERAITSILKRGKLPIICGGTGFYISALLGEVSMPEVSPNKQLRKKLSKLSKAELFALLKKKDPRRALTIDKDNPVRLVRAIEIADALGSVPPSRARSANYAVIKIGLDFPDTVLKERIAKRLEARMKKGMLKEAERLHDDGLSFKRMEELGLEYRYLARLLQKKITKQQFTKELQNEIWHYVKRQRTWFKRDKTISWIKV